MPTYEYLCTECGDRKEVVQSFTEHSLTTCEVCGGKLRKVIFPVGIQFKGSGFYSTDRRASQPMSRAGKQDAKGEAKEAKESKDSKDSKSESSSETKSETKSESKNDSKKSGSGSSSNSKDSGSTTKKAVEKSA